MKPPEPEIVGHWTGNPNYPDREVVGIKSMDSQGGAWAVFFTMNGQTFYLPRHSKTTKDEARLAAVDFATAFERLDEINQLAAERADTPSEV